jgi:hypothetical protein
MIRKYSQIDHFVELVRPLIDSDPSEPSPSGLRLRQELFKFCFEFLYREVLRRRCRITGVDIAPGVVEASRETARRLGYNNMEFICADLREYEAISPAW